MKNEKNEKNTTDKPAEAPAPASYVVKIGQVMVGKGQVRKPGDVIKDGELSKAEVAFFLKDGTIAEAAAQ